MSDVQLAQFLYRDLLFHKFCHLEFGANVPEVSTLTDSPAFNFYSLQMPVSEAEKAQLNQHGVTNLESELSSYAYTGALIKQLDLVICVDTSVAHLAAALNVPAWILIAAHSDWRWLEGRDSTPWYPDATLIRRSTPDNWVELVARVSQQLGDLSETSG